MRARLLVAIGLLLLPTVVGCQPAAYPRTGEVAPRGGVSAEGALQAIAYEPQRVTLTNGRSLGSNVAFFPIVNVGLRWGIGGCEFGGVVGTLRVLTELRCGLLQERRGAPFSLAASGAFGIDWLTFGPVGRIGLDASVRLGPVRPIVDVYLSTNRALRYVEDHAPEVVSGEGPLSPSMTTTRYELRITVPVGIAIDLPPIDGTSAALVLGATPYRVLRFSPCRECGGVQSWDADLGVGFDIGLEFRSR